MKIVHYYRRTDTPHSLLPSIGEQLSSGGCDVVSIDAEYCFNVQIDSHPLDDVSTSRLEWLLRETFDVDGLRLESSALDDIADVGGGRAMVVEFGPRMTFTSAFSSNATSRCTNILQ